MKCRVRVAGIVILSIFLFSAYFISYNALFIKKKEVASEAMDKAGGVLVSLPPTVLRFLAGEFKGLVADYLVLEAGAQMGTYVRRTVDGKYEVIDKELDWHEIHQLFVASQVLDPSFQQTYLLAQGSLPWEAGLVNETQKILQTAALNRPWDWQPLQLKGFNYYFFLKNFGEAGKIFLEAAKIPNAPSYLAILGARLALQGGETEAAIFLLQSMLQGKSEDDPGYEDIVQRLNALKGTLVLTKAAKQYENHYDHPPPSVSHLVTSGFLSKLPKNPYNVAYCIDTAGTVHFDKPNCRDAN